MSSRAIAALAVCTMAASLSPAFADDALRPLCPDRPGKGTSACTLDAGHFQVEIDGFDATLDRHKGVTTDTYVAFNPQIKYGVSDTFDIEASFAPFNNVRTHDSATGTTQTVSGVGDLYLRGKWNFLGNSDDPFTAVVEPFVKVPTAAHAIGNGALEGGVVVPLAYDLGNNWQLSLTPETDILKNASNDGHHATFINVIGIGHTFDNGITIDSELWGAVDDDPAGSTSQASFDMDICWQPNDQPDLQLDAGVNFGLNPNTPDVQMYTGITRRF